MKVNPFIGLVEGGARTSYIRNLREDEPPISLPSFIKTSSLSYESPSPYVNIHDKEIVGKVQFRTLVHSYEAVSSAWQATSPGDVDTETSDSNFHYLAYKF